MNSDTPVPPVERSLRAPWWVYIVLLGLIAAKVVEVVVTLSNLTALDGLPLPFSPIIRVIFAGYWLVTLVVCTAAAWRRARWVFRWIAPVVSLYALTHVIWQVLFFRSDFDRGRLGFQIVISVVLLLPLWLTAWQRRWLLWSASTSVLSERNDM